MSTVVRSEWFETPLSSCSLINSATSKAFPIVFTGIYGFSLGISALPFVGFVVTGAITVRPFNSSRPEIRHSPSRPFLVRWILLLQQVQHGPSSEERPQPPRRGPPRARDGREFLHSRFAVPVWMVLAGFGSLDRACHRSSALPSGGVPRFPIHHASLNSRGLKKCGKGH